MRMIDRSGSCVEACHEDDQMNSMMMTDVINENFQINHDRGKIVNV